VVGVSDPTLAEKMLGVLQANGATRAMVVFGHDGLDELTTTTTSTVLELRDGDIRTYEVDPSALGLSTTSGDALLGGDAATNAELARRILDGEEGPHLEIVLLNAAAGIVTSGVADDLAEGLDRARASLAEGAAGEVLERLVAASSAAAART
jgi:anthranilate phosphoribosyltransferase